MSSTVAISAADSRSTSRRISTARWRGGSSWITARNVSSIVSRANSAASGSSSDGQQHVRVRLQPRHVHERAQRRHAAGSCALIASRHALVAILYSHARSHSSLRELRARAPGAQQRLLHEVLGLLEGPHHPVAVDVQLAAVALGAHSELVRHGASHLARDQAAGGVDDPRGDRARPLGRQERRGLGDLLRAPARAAASSPARRPRGSPPASTPAIAGLTAASFSDVNVPRTAAVWIPTTRTPAGPSSAAR